MSANIERLALDAVAGDDADIGLDTLTQLRAELVTLCTALLSEQGPINTSVAATVVSGMVNRIDLALALAQRDGDEVSEAAE